MPVTGLCGLRWMRMNDGFMAVLALLVARLPSMRSGRV
jgi:hypothetical protein